MTNLLMELNVYGDIFRGKMIRKAKLGDIDSIAYIISTVWKDAYKGVIDDDFINGRTVESMIAILKNIFHDMLFFVFEEENIVKGVVSGKNINLNSCEIIQLYVGLEFQGNNIGTELLNYMKLYYKDKGCKNMIIWTLKNIRNNGFYRKNGGEVAEEKELEIGNKKYSGIGFTYKL